MNFITLFTSKNIDITKRFYECLDLKFVSEQHGKGPQHYSYSFKDSLLEIYPETTAKKDRISFIIFVDNIEYILGEAVKHGGKILENITNENSKRLIIEDPDGRTIRLLEKYNP